MRTVGIRRTIFIFILLLSLGVCLTGSALASEFKAAKFLTAAHALKVGVTADVLNCGSPTQCLKQRDRAASPFLIEFSCNDIYTLDDYGSPYSKTPHIIAHTVGKVKVPIYKTKRVDIRGTNRWVLRKVKVGTKKRRVLLGYVSSVEEDVTCGRKGLEGGISPTAYTQLEIPSNLAYRVLGRVKRVRLSFAMTKLDSPYVGEASPIGFVKQSLVVPFRHFASECYSSIQPKAVAAVGQVGNNPPNIEVEHGRFGVGDEYTSLIPVSYASPTYSLVLEYGDQFADKSVMLDQDRDNVAISYSVDGKVVKSEPSRSIQYEQGVPYNDQGEFIPTWTEFSSFVYTFPLGSHTVQIRAEDLRGSDHARH